MKISPSLKKKSDTILTEIQLHQQTSTCSKTTIERLEKVRNMFEVNNRKTTKMCEACLKLTMKTPEPYQHGCSGVFII